MAFIFEGDVEEGETEENKRGRTRERHLGERRGEKEKKEKKKEGEREWVDSRTRKEQPGREDRKREWGKGGKTSVTFGNIGKKIKEQKFEEFSVIILL